MSLPDECVDRAFGLAALVGGALVVGCHLVDRGSELCDGGGVAGETGGGVPVGLGGGGSSLGQVHARALDQGTNETVEHCLALPMGAGIGRQEELHGFLEPATRQGAFATF